MWHSSWVSMTNKTSADHNNRVAYHFNIRHNLVSPCGRIIIIICPKGDASIRLRASYYLKTKMKQHLKKERGQWKPFCSYSRPYTSLPNDYGKKLIMMMVLVVVMMMMTMTTMMMMMLAIYDLIDWFADWLIDWWWCWSWW